jgi:hypothetical protein
MVRSDGGQLYTIEGIAAALIMLITAYMVVNATSVYTAGDTHISDMQLEQMGSDALTMMATPKDSDDNQEGKSTLRSILEKAPGYTFGDFGITFRDLIRSQGTGPTREIQFIAKYTCRQSNTGDVFSDNLISSSGRDLTGTEHPVRVTKWVIADMPCGAHELERKRAVLVEVLLWID